MAASGAGGSGVCLPSGARSWLEPSLPEQVLGLLRGCCTAIQSVSKMVSPDSLASIFLQVSHCEDFSCASSGQCKDQEDFLSLPCCCRAACCPQDTS